MDLKEFALQTTEGRHPWELSRAAFFRFRLRREFSAPVEALDIGCGDAWLAENLLSALPQASQIQCVDNSLTEEAIAILRPVSSAVELRAEVSAGKCADLVLLLDVLEHVENDEGFLKNIVQNQLREKAIALISVPAHPSIFSAHDVWLGHFRRYSPSAARNLVRSAGLEILSEGGLFSSLLVVRRLQILFAKKKPSSEGVARWKHGVWLTGFLVFILNVEWRLMEFLRTVGISLPGLSWWCVCRKA